MQLLHLHSDGSSKSLQAYAKRTLFTNECEDFGINSINDCFLIGSRQYKRLASQPKWPHCKTNAHTCERLEVSRTSASFSTHSPLNEGALHARAHLHIAQCTTGLCVSLRCHIAQTCSHTESCNSGQLSGSEGAPVEARIVYKQTHEYCCATFNVTMKCAKRSLVVDSAREIIHCTHIPKHIVHYEFVQLLL